MALKLRLIILLLSAAAGIARAQDLRGVWVGGLTSDTTGVPVINTNYVLNIKEQGNGVIRGRAYVIERKFDFESVLDFIGVIDGSLVTITEMRIRSWKTPVDTKFLCLKFLHLTESLSKDKLEGPWTGHLESYEECTPGQALLQRFSAAGKVAIPANVMQEILRDPPGLEFMKTTLYNPVLVTVSSRNIQLSVNDYLKEDGDTVSVYQNREPLIRKIRIEKKPFLKKVKLEAADGGVDEIIVYANNLGEVPPNTCTMIIDDGIKKQSINIISTRQNSASIYIRVKPAEK